MKIKVLKYLLGAGWQVILCRVQHDFLEGPFSQQLRSDLPHLIEISNEISYVVAVASFLREVPRPILTSILYSTCEEDSLYRPLRKIWIGLERSS